MLIPQPANLICRCAPAYAVYVDFGIAPTVVANTARVASRMRCLYQASRRWVE